MGQGAGRTKKGVAPRKCRWWGPLTPFSTVVFSASKQRKEALCVGTSSSKVNNSRIIPNLVEILEAYLKVNLAPSSNTPLQGHSLTSIFVSSKPPCSFKVSIIKLQLYLRSYLAQGSFLEFSKAAQSHGIQFESFMSCSNFIHQSSSSLGLRERPHASKMVRKIV